MRTQSSRFGFGTLAGTVALALAALLDLDGDHRRRLDIGFGEADLATAVSNSGLRDALRFLLQVVDPLWLVLAAANVYAALATSEGLDVARRWATILLAAAFAAAAMSAMFRPATGPVHYTGGWE
jgi:hypothetical protein